MWTNQGKGELSPRPCYRTEVRDFNGKESSVLLFEESARFSIEVSFTNPVNSNSTCKLPFEEHLKPNCQRSGYVFGMKKRKQSGCAPDDVSEWEGQ